MVQKEIDYFLAKYFTNKIIGITIPIAKTAYRIPIFRMKYIKINDRSNNSRKNNPPLRSETNCFLLAL